MDRCCLSSLRSGLSVLSFEERKVAAHHLRVWASDGVAVQSRELQESKVCCLATVHCSPAKGVTSLFSWKAMSFL